MKYVDKAMVLRVLQEEADLDGYEIDIVDAGTGDAGYRNFEIRLRTGGSTPILFSELVRIRERILARPHGTPGPVVSVRPDKNGPWLVLHFYCEYVYQDFYTNNKQ